MLTNDRIHRAIDDDHLDELAAQSGCTSRIGRLSFTPDCVYGMLLGRLEQRGARSVLELGCGRGALARWFFQRNARLDYVGVDESVTAIAAARRVAPIGRFFVGTAGSFETRPRDAVVSLDSIATQTLDIDDAHRIVRMLRPAGTFFAGTTIVSEGQQEVLAQNCFVLRAAGAIVTYEDWSRELEGNVLAIAATWLNTTRWPDDVRGQLTDEARTVVEAIRDRRFRYTTIDARRAP